MVMSTKFSVGIQEVNQPRMIIDTTSWCQIERMTHSQTNGRENVNTRKSNCSAMTKPKDKISDIRNSTATMEESLTSKSTGSIREKAILQNTGA